MELGLHSADTLWINQDLGDGAGWSLLGKQYVKGTLHTGHLRSAAMLLLLRFLSDTVWNSGML